MDSTAKDQLYPVMEETANLYFKQNKFKEFAELLESLRTKRPNMNAVIDYYVALCRYTHLKYLEQSQNWEEYFANGNSYRQQTVSLAKNSIDGLAADDSISLRARLLLWQFYNDQQDILREAALADLMAVTRELAQKSPEIPLIKAVADQLLSGGEKAKSREVYKIYVNKLITSQISDSELKNTADKFYKEGNLELAQVIYDACIENVLKAPAPEKAIPFLEEVARSFVYSDKQISDPDYAEKVFKKIEEIGGSDALGEDLLYLRAYSLEKSKDYRSASEIYIKFLGKFPSSAYADIAGYKSGMILAYALGDLDSAKKYFDKLSQKSPANSASISALYQLGLLNQWQGESEKAKGYYAALLEKAQGGFSEIVSLAQARSKEIETAKPIEYNLKMFLDASFKTPAQPAGASQVELKAAPFKAKIAEEFKLSSKVYTGESGCFQVEVQHLWSGNTGKFAPSSGQADFSTQYVDSGIKEINLVVVGPSGVIGRNFELLDVE